MASRWSPGRRAARGRRHGFFVSPKWQGVFAAVASYSPAIPPLSASVVPTGATSNWSGYGLAGNGFTGVTGTFNVPAPTEAGSCLEDTAVWVGVDGVGSHDLLQAGIAEIGFAQASPLIWPSSGFSGLICSGRAQVYAWWEDLPSRAQWVRLPVKVGDSVTVSIFKMSPGWWALAVHDLTAKQSFLLAQPYAAPDLGGMGGRDPSAHRVLEGPGPLWRGPLSGPWCAG